MRNVLKWIAALTTAAAAMAIDVMPHIALSWIPFIGYIIGSTLWCYTAVKDKEWALAALNVFFTIANLYAIIIRI